MKRKDLLSGDRLTLPAGGAAALWRHFRAAAAPLWQALAPARLELRQRMSFSGHLFVGATQVVAAVADTLRAMPALFAAVPVVGTALLSDQDEALCWLFLSQELHELGDLAHDAYLRRQCGAIMTAMALMEHERHAAQLPMLTEEERDLHLLRMIHLAAAQKLLTDRQRRKVRARLLRTAP